MTEIVLIPILAVQIIFGQISQSLGVIDRLRLSIYLFLMLLILLIFIMERKVKGSIMNLIPYLILIYSGASALYLVLIDNEELIQGEFRQISLYAIERSNWVTTASMLA